ncbi:hypothetical protein L915_14435 [Phytophthora nicotianae]|uniref:Uncharacterized protein n=1 Tax=Phytophthora nicotianae TaxID=4792 RepID=W2III3_PHYNI|nr:hypothetical protein L915_14435 [Phytophthora nicotianae]ETL33148.1 hypothetical protein L916_14341 [Phytophthora nicotianae]ETM39575.1 hypothetical protein L914_14283 [Phytophthora nicotianae]
MPTTRRVVLTVGLLAQSITTTDTRMRMIGRFKNPALKKREPLSAK